MIEAFPFPWVSVVHPPTWIRLLQEQLQRRQHGQGGLGKSAQALPYSPCSRGQGQEGALGTSCCTQPQCWQVTLQVTGTCDSWLCARSPNPGGLLAVEEALCLLGDFPLTLEQPRFQASGLIACAELRGKRAWLR